MWLWGFKHNCLSQLERKLWPKLSYNICNQNPAYLNHWTSEEERVYSHKYLGVWLTSTLNWSTQITEIFKKARSQLGVIYRNFYQHSNSTTLFQLYISYVRPHLEYAATVWDPHQVGLNRSLENIQKFALRMCTKNWNQEYDVLLNSYGIPTLAVRRKQLKLCLYFKWWMDRYPSPILLLWEDQLSTSGTRILTFLYNQLYTQAHISFPSFPMLSHCGTNYQTLCMTVRQSSHSSTIYVFCISGCLLYM